MTVLDSESECTGEESGTPPPRKKSCVYGSEHKSYGKSTPTKRILFDKTPYSYLSPEYTPFRYTKSENMMVSGYESVNQSGSFYRSSAADSHPSSRSDTTPATPPIASLHNLGNTCFLNSILYTLRFAPIFLHKLHHLSNDAVLFSKQFNQIRQERSSSLGRNFSNSPIWSKDCLSDPIPSLDHKIQSVIDKLHQVYRSLYNNEHRERNDAFQPTVFLEALRDVNRMFEGNHQHDAHELLVCLLDILREACGALYNRKSILDRRSNTPSPTPGHTSSFKAFKNSLRFSKTRPEKNILRENVSEGDISGKSAINGGESPATSRGEDKFEFGVNTLIDDFQGESILTTTCMECEHVTERSETFCDICIPFNEETSPAYETENPDGNELFHSLIVTEEFLNNENKYWCNGCSRYAEASRCVRYKRLPRLLTMHLKRFSSTYGLAASKIHDHMPTPFTLECFCDDCKSTENHSDSLHLYKLYAIVTHLGTTIASGHYIAYVKAYNNMEDYLGCNRDMPKTASLSRGQSNADASSEKKGSFRRFFQRKNNSSPGWEEKITCKGVECCRVKGASDSSSEHEEQQMWFECDDETIRSIKEGDFVQMLKPKENNSFTPYLLFYYREVK